MYAAPIPIPPPTPPPSSSSSSSGPPSEPKVSNPIVHHLKGNKKNKKKTDSSNSSSATTTNPILQRYLTTPINFRLAKRPESISSIDKLPSSYIVLSKNSLNRDNTENDSMKTRGNSNGTLLGNDSPQSKKKSNVNRPKSLVEAVASYKGNKYERVKSRKRKRKLEELVREDLDNKDDHDDDDDDDDRDEDNEKEEFDGEPGWKTRMNGEIVETGDNKSLGSFYKQQQFKHQKDEHNGQPPLKKPKGIWGSLKSLFGSTPPASTDGEDGDEDVGEEYVEGEDLDIDDSDLNSSKHKSFGLTEIVKKVTGGRADGEDYDNDNDNDDLSTSSSSSSAGEVYDENSPFTGFSEAEKSDANQSERDDLEEEDIEESLENEDENEDEDESEDVEYKDDNSEDEEDEKDEFSPGSSSQEHSPDVDADLSKLRADLKLDELINGLGRDVANSNVVDQGTKEREGKERGEANLVNNALEAGKGTSVGIKINSTPPTSPEEFAEDGGKIAFYNINELDLDRGSNGSKRIYKNWRGVQQQTKGPVGLLNHGVTCYMNSAIQSLIHIPAVQHYLDEISQGKVSNLKPRSVSHVLAELSRKMWAPKNSKAMYINPKKLIQRLDEINCMMSEWQQEDSHEYYMSLMSRLQEDSTPKGKKLNESIIYDIFGGLLNQKITCLRCGNISITKQEFYDLSLGLNKRKLLNNGGSGGMSNDIPALSSSKFSIEKSIADFFSNETIRKTDADKKSGYYCEQCHEFTQANKISSIIRAPETLTVHFKRFKFNGNSLSKVKQSIGYSKYLDLSAYMEHETDSAYYRLISVIVHEGRLISSGHYITHVLQPNGQSWATYDDEYINPIEERKALNDPNAYVLVYTKLTPKHKQGGN